MKEIEDKILALTKLKNPDDPVEYVKNIVKSYAIEKVNDAIKHCNKCDISNFGIKSIGYGNAKASILMICDAVSEEQYKSGQKITLPLLDSDGDTLNRALKYMGANKEAIYMVNSVNCYPAKQVKEIKKRSPSIKERTACKTFIDRLIEAINPSVIITLGSVATNALSEVKLSMMESRGVSFTYKGYTVVPTFHPGFFEKMANQLDEDVINSYKDSFLMDLYNAFTIARANDPNCNIGNVQM